MDLEKELLATAATQVCNQLDKEILEWTINPLAKSLSELKEAEQNLKLAKEEETKYGSEEHVYGDFQNCSYGERVRRCTERYNEALKRYNYHKENV